MPAPGRRHCRLPGARQQRVGRPRPQFQSRRPGARRPSGPGAPGGGHRGGGGHRRRFAPPAPVYRRGLRRRCPGGGESGTSNEPWPWAGGRCAAPRPRPSAPPAAGAGSASYASGDRRRPGHLSLRAAVGRREGRWPRSAGRPVSGAGAVSLCPAGRGWWRRPRRQTCERNERPTANIASRSLLVKISGLSLWSHLINRALPGASVSPAALPRMVWKQASSATGT